MKKYLRNIFSLLCLILFVFAGAEKALATHSMGADLTYRCVAANTYEITLSFYRDCVGVAADDSAYVDASSSCQGLYYVYLLRVPGTGQEITPLCPSEISTCSGGTFTGIQEYVFKRTVILPGPCADWIFSYNQCCRNNAITNITTPGAWQMYVYATLNSLITPCNNSPTFSNKPVPFVCLGQQFCFNHGAYDVDGDSLVYSLITPWDSPGLQITYLVPFSATNPLSSNPAVSFNPMTGDICMTPTGMEVTVMAVLVQEYRNGVLIGSVERDIQVTVIACTNQVPALTGMNGTNSFSQTVCAGSQFCFTINSTDADAVQNTYVTWDNSISGASFTVAAGNRESATFCWTPSVADINSSPHCFTATVQDNNCPLFGSQTFSYCITVEGMEVTVPSLTIGCNSTTPINASATGGSGGYTYLWSNGATTQSITVGPGSYTVTATDGICTATATSIISQSASVTSSVVSSDVSCNGGNDGTATVTGGGGTNPFTYSWSPTGGTGVTANNLSSGNYTVTVTDAMGCTSTSSVTISEPTLLTASTQATDVLCNGESNGSATVTAANGTAGYAYSWSPSGGSAVAANGLAAGTYTVTVTDANGCTATASAVVAEPAALTASAVSSDVLCNGGNDGTATVSASYGTAGYTYSWSPSGGNAATANGLSAGAYIVTVTDANGCTTSATATVSEPTLLTAGATATPALCNGSADGTATVNANDGTPGYSYSWSPSGGSGTNATGLTAGSYTVTVTDANGCTTTANITVTEPTALTASVSSTAVLCNSGNDGTATVAANDGTPGYSYAWSPSGGTGATENGLSAGNYPVIVTDANGCTISAIATVSEPTQLTAVASSIPVLCNGGSDGEASVIANDGTPGYTYSWTSGGSGSSENSLSAGSYTVTVTDANGCSVTATATVTEPTALTAVASSAPVMCNGGSDGSATVIANDGTPGYTYSWSSGGSGSTENSLSAGTYDVTVTDANGCTTSASTTVNEPTLLTASATSTPALCNGSSDGTATVTANDGTPGYTYSWSSGGSAVTESGLVAGVYVVTVTDANGCTTVANTFVTEPTLLTATTTSVPVLCNGGADGSASVVANDGTPGYTYSWSQTGGTGVTDPGLAAGVYSVTVTDANGCTVTVNATVNEPALIVPAASATSCLCNGSSDGSVSVNVTGGVGAYAFLWSPGGAATATVNNIPAGSYTVTVTDDNGCSAVTTVPVNEPAVLSLVMSSTPALCNGDSTGTATVAVNGGTSAYAYSWFPGGGTSSTSSNLPAGNYIVNITDANGCNAMDSVSVSEPIAIALSTSTIPALCGSSNGSASINASGGSAPYQYSWSPSGGTSSSATNISAGAYTITVTDANGCTGSTIANVLNTGGPSVNASITTNVSCNGGNDGSASVNVSNGTAPFTYIWSPAGGTGASATGLPAGNYSVSVTDANGCVSSDNVTVTEPSPVAAQTVTSNTLCFGSADGSATVNPSGGTGPYTFSWAPGGDSLSTALNLVTGNYTVTVTDANGCSTSAVATVQQPAALALVMSSVPALCNGTATGNASVNVSGGTSGYSYLWTPGNSSTQNAGNLSAGSYTVTVTDAHGCTAANTIGVSEPTPVNLSVSSTPAICGSSNGSATVNAAGGAGSYSYQWSPSGGTNATAMNLPAGTFTVMVTDANGCTATDQVNVSNAGGPVASAIVNSNVQCFGGNDGSASLNISSGNPPFTYVWSPSGGNGLLASGLIAGNYSIIISDVNGCITVANITITEPPELISTVTSTAATCGDANGSASVNASGGTGALTYSWSPSGGTSANATGLAGGNYSVLVTDANGCTSSVSTTVINAGGAVASLQSSSNVTCHGGNNGSAAVSVSGGAGPFTFLWTPSGDTTAATNNLQAGNYSVLITDTVGCISTVNVTITEPPALLLQMGMTPAGCNGAADGSAVAQLSGGVGPYSYSWSPVAGIDSMVNNITAGTYTVMVTDNNGCTDSASVTVTSPSSVTLTISSTDVTCYGEGNGSAHVVTTGGTFPFTYSWSPVGGTTPVAQNLSPGNYDVTVTDSNGCMSVISAVITQPPSLAFTVAPAITLCVDQSTTIWANATGGTQPYAYVWDNNVTTDSQFVTPAATTTYSVEVTDANGCTLPAQSVTITMNPPLNLSASATPEICAGDVANISSIAGGGNGGPYTYSWNNGSILSAGATVSPLTDSIFTVTVNDGCSPPVQTAVTIIVNPVPEVNFLPQLLEGCMPVPAAFENHGSVPAGSVYSWDLGDGTFSSENTVSHTYATPGHYTVSLVVTSTEGCTDELTVVNAVNVFGLPSAMFEMSAHEVTILTPSVDFTDGSTDVVSWHWDFGDNGTSADVNPVHNYIDTGSYTIQLIVENEHGCLDTTYNVLRIVDDFTVFIPDAFTPNGDLVNDNFMAHGIGWKDFEMFIIDRWGLQIFHSMSKDHPWNGTFYDGSRRCQSDVYEYIIRIHDKEGKLHRFLGHVTLVN